MNLTPLFGRLQLSRLGVLQMAIWLIVTLAFFLLASGVLTFALVSCVFALLLYGYDFQHDRVIIKLFRFWPVSVAEYQTITNVTRANRADIWRCRKPSDLDLAEWRCSRFFVRPLVIHFRGS